MFNAKVGNNLWSALLGDQKLSLTKSVRLLTETYDLTAREGREFFDLAFRSLVWMTYRTGFVPLLENLPAAVFAQLSDKIIEDTKKLYSSDNGWGCTIRVGQTALANALVRHVYDRQFSVEVAAKAGAGSPYEGILRLFWDSGKDNKYPFSIQSFCEAALKYKRVPGEWLSQSTVATILRDLNQKHRPFKDLNIVTFIDGSVYEDQLGVEGFFEPSSFTKDYDVVYEEEAKGEENTVQVTEEATVIFVSCALGLKSPEPTYLDRLKELFDFPQLIGVMGGRTSEALFFVGYQGDNFVFLDPHFVQVKCDLFMRG